MQAAIIRWGAILLAFGLVIGWGFWQRGSKESALRAMDAAQAESRSLRADLAVAQETIDTERQYAQRLQAIATRYEGDKNAIERQAASDLADLRSGNLRLREQWRGCEARQAQVGGAAGQSDGGADLRAESASRIVRAAAECDAQVKGLQAVIRSDRLDQTPDGN